MSRYQELMNIAKNADYMSEAEFNELLAIVKKGGQLGTSIALLIKGIAVSGLLIATHELNKQLEKRGITK